MTRKTNLALAFTDEQAMILETAKGFCADRSDITAVRRLLGSDNGYSADIWAEMVGLGWTGIAIPEQYGGSELGISLVICASTLWRNVWRVCCEHEIERCST